MRLLCAYKRKAGAFCIPAMATWSIHAKSRKSKVSGEPFADGAQIVSFLRLDEQGVLDRLDVLESEVDPESPPEGVFAWWRQIVESNVAAAEERKARLKGHEDVFLSMYGIDPSEQAGESDEEKTVSPPEDADRPRALLLQLLALLLERKRVLRRLGGTRGNVLRYRHAGLNLVLEVPNSEASPEELMEIEGQLSLLI